MSARFAIVVMLLSACASHALVVETHTYANQPGDPIEITLEPANVQQEPTEGSFTRTLRLTVRVANNSGDDVTVTHVNVYQQSIGGIVADATAVHEDVTIVPGNEHRFALAATLRRTRETSAMSEFAVPLTLRVVVTLANGDRYAKQFEIPIDLH
jgi:hypothetical protein